MVILKWGVLLKGNCIYNGWLNRMVLLLNGNSEHVAQACRKIDLFGEKKSELCLLSIKSNALTRSNNRNFSYFCVAI